VLFRSGQKSVAKSKQIVQDGCSPSQRPRPEQQWKQQTDCEA